ncbi:hypothetical protein [Streptomyces sp. NPDC059378]|uniref:hypothetical protein n=1 Tax=Streptomyces sp. NPDC059378 TaxID=3346815 RepID=UPI00369C6D03
MRFRSRLTKLAACAATAAGLTVAVATSASAADFTVPIYGTSGYYLGSGTFTSGGSGTIQVYDAYCDGDNGIIAAAYVVRNGSWTTSGLVGTRGCGTTNTNNLSDNDPRPGAGEEVKFSVCKLLPDGTWKDCQTYYIHND